MDGEDCPLGPIGPPPAPDVVVRENELFARVWFSRTGVDNVVETLDYFTADGPARFPAQPARAGVDYVARSGTVTFPIGQNIVSVDIPIIDNGLVDGFKDFTLMLTNSEGGLVAGPWVRIEDNELGSAVDPLFVPDGSFQWATPLPMPDGRVLVSGPWWLGVGTGWEMLQPNGCLDVNFRTTFARTFRDLSSNASSAAVWALAVLGDGRILADAVQYNGTNPSVRRLVRVLPTGALDKVFAISAFSDYVVAQPDGKILVTVETNNAPTLSRLNSDGSPDPGFSSSRTAWFALQNDGKILIAASNSLARLNSDGSHDNTFSPPFSTNGIGYLLQRRNGKMIVSYEGSVTQMNADGSLDASFGFEALPPSLGLWWLVEAPDGRLLSDLIDFSNDTSTGAGAVFRWNNDGSLESQFARFTQPGGYWPCDSGSFPPSFVSDTAGQVFMAGSFTSVDGFPRPGLARLFINPPERDFRVFTPSEFSRSGGVAHVRVVRTGPTTNAASVSFTTSDATAKAGIDYVAQSGTLNFAPLEVSKEVTVPLFNGTGTLERITFNLELNNPSAGYTNIVSTPIVVLPDLRLALTESLLGTNGSVTLELRGTIPGLFYSLEASSHFTNWSSLTTVQAIGHTTRLNAVAPSGSAMFFRARRAE